MALPKKKSSLLLPLGLAAGALLLFASTQSHASESASVSPDVLPGAPSGDNASDEDAAAKGSSSPAAGASPGGDDDDDNAGSGAGAATDDDGNLPTENTYASSSRSEGGAGDDSDAGSEGGGSSSSGGAGAEAAKLSPIPEDATAAMTTAAAGSVGAAGPITTAMAAMAALAASPAATVNANVLSDDLAIYRPDLYRALYAKKHKSMSKATALRHANALILKVKKKRDAKATAAQKKFRKMVVKLSPSVSQMVTAASVATGIPLPTIYAATAAQKATVRKHKAHHPVKKAAHHPAKKTAHHTAAKHPAHKKTAHRKKPLHPKP